MVALCGHEQRWYSNQVAPGDFFRYGPTTGECGSPRAHIGVALGPSPRCVHSWENLCYGLWVAVAPMFREYGHLTYGRMALLWVWPIGWVGVSERIAAYSIYIYFIPLQYPTPLDMAPSPGDGAIRMARPGGSVKHRTHSVLQVIIQMPIGRAGDLSATQLPATRYPS